MDFHKAVNMIPAASTARGGISGSAEEPRPRFTVHMACEELEKQITMLHEVVLSLDERLLPLLEVSNENSQEGKTPMEATAPLAQAVSEYALRVKQIRRRLEDKVVRLAI